MANKEKENAFLSQRLHESSSIEKLMIKAVIDLAFAITACRQYDQKETKSA